MEKDMVPPRSGPQPRQAFFHELKAGTVKGGDGFKKPYIPILSQTDDVRTLFCGEGERLFHDDASSGLHGAESVGIVHGIDRPVIDDVIIAFGQKLVIVRIDGGDLVHFTPGRPWIRFAAGSRLR